MAVDCDVIVAGGGPVGLLVGYLCAESGVTTRVFECAPALAQDLRATSVHPPTLDMLARIEMAEELVAQGLVCESWQIRDLTTGARVEFALSSIKDDTGHPFRLQCEQWKLSRALLRRLDGHPRARVDFGTTVADFAQDDDGVDVRVERNGQPERLRARLLVGADGLASTVRRRLGLPFEGETFPETTLVVTTPFAFEDHIDGLSIVASCWTADSHVAVLKLPGFWRLALYPDETLPIEKLDTAEAVEAALQAIVPRPAPFPVIKRWPYRVQQRIVPAYRVGRVALAGDAAHVNSPAGGMGLNAGLHDAFALADALIEIVRHGARLERLDLYDRRRRPVAAEHILGLAGRNRDRMREKNPARRRAILAELQAVAGDRDKARAFVRRASMIDGLRQAAAVS